MFTRLKTPLMFFAAFISMISTVSAVDYKSPWKSSNYLYSESTPSLDIGTPIKLFNKSKRLYLCGQDGVMLFKLEDKKWKLVSTARFSITDAALGEKYLAIASSEGIVLLDPASGETLRKSGKLPVNSVFKRHTAVSSLPDGGFIVFMVDKLYRYNPDDDTIIILHGGLKNTPTSFAELNGRIYIFNDGKLLCYDGKQTYEYKFNGEKIRLPGQPKNIFSLPGGKWLGFGSVVSGACLLNPETGEIIDYTGRDNPVGLELAWWGMTWDEQSNVLYLPGWNSITVINNADIPRKWKIVDRLGSCSAVFLYTHKSVYPRGRESVLYLPETRQLVFANACGISILNGDSCSFGLPENENFAQFAVDNSELPGKGDFYDKLRKEKFVAMYATSSVRLSEEELRNYRRFGVGALVFNIFNIEHGQFYPPHDVRDELARIQTLCAENNMELFAHLTPYNISINNSSQLTPYVYRNLILATGAPGSILGTARMDKYPRRVFPCYNDREYSQRAGIAHQLRELAELSRRIELRGVCFELGDGFNGTNIKVRSEPCFCDFCWQGFLRENPSGSSGADLELEPEKRYRRLLNLKKWEEYLNYQRRNLAELCRDALTEARKINPDLIIKLMLPETTQPYPECWFYNAFIEGMGSAEKPVLVASEQTYGSPFIPMLVNKTEEQWSKQGLHVIFIPGISYFWMSPRTFASRYEKYLKHSAGIFIYQGNHFSDKYLNKNVFQPLQGFPKAEYTLADYFEAKTKSETRGFSGE